MKFLIIIFLSVTTLVSICQSRDSIVVNKPTAAPAIKNIVPVKNNPPITSATYKPEIFTSGFIDIVNSGQVNASARFIRLFIGEPGLLPNGKRRFAIPLSIYSGVSANNFSNGTNSSQNQQAVYGQRNNDHLVNGFINPLSGLLNISADGLNYFNNKQTKLTNAGFIYHGGLRVLTGYRAGLANNPNTGKPLNFFNSFVTSGFYFQTGAWERSNTKNVGVFWLTARYILCKSSPKQLKEIMPSIKTNGFYHGWSAGGGIDINNLINIKVVYYKYVKKPEIEYSLPIYQFSFNYTLKK